MIGGSKLGFWMKKVCENRKFLWTAQMRNHVTILAIMSRFWAIMSRFWHHVAIWLGRMTFLKHQEIVSRLTKITSRSWANSIITYIVLLNQLSLYMKKNVIIWCKFIWIDVNAYMNNIIVCACCWSVVDVRWVVLSKLGSVS